MNQATLRRFAAGTAVVSLASSLLLGIPAYAAMDNQPAAHWVAGAYLAPPMGPGTGRIDAWQVGTAIARDATFGKAKTPAGNSFYVAYDRANGNIYVPSLAARTDILSADSLATQGHFATIVGGRVARITPDNRFLVVVAGKETAGYSLPDHKRVFDVKRGGNAIVFSPDGKHAYMGGNMDARLTEIDIPSGKVVRTFPVPHSGDLAWADNKIFSADMKTGVMSVLYPDSGKVVHIRTPEVDARFNYKTIPKAKAGFMQLAVDAAHHKVYAAGFSGHILSFASDDPRYLGEVAVRVNGAGKPNKLSGLVVVDGGREALTTVENLKMSVIVRLSDGKIVRRLPGTASNRWIKLYG